MNTIVVPEANALDALASLHPADAQILRDAATQLRTLSAECQRLRDAGRDENSRLLLARAENAKLREILKRICPDELTINTAVSPKEVRALLA